MRLRFLGTGAGGGVPSFFCACPACREARSEPGYRRTRCAVLIQGEMNTLIDAPPDLRGQLIDCNAEAIDNFILTHSHYDHSGGLGELEFYVWVSRQAAIPTYLTVETREWLHAAYGFMADCLDIRPQADSAHFELDGVCYSPVAVTHAPGTMGLLIETDRVRMAYIPDTGPLPEATAEKLAGIDLLILGATFWGRNWMPADHLSVQEAVQIGAVLNVKQLYLTHLSMHYDTPVTNQELEEYLHSFGEHFHLAYDGLEITL